MALEDTRASRAAKLFSEGEGLVGSQIASFEAKSTTQMSKISKGSNVAEKAGILTSQASVGSPVVSETTGGFAGRKGFQLLNSDYQKIRNNDAIINGRTYVAYARPNVK